MDENVPLNFSLAITFSLILSHFFQLKESMSDSYTITCYNLILIE